MILPSALEAYRDGLLPFIDIGQRHPEQTVATVDVAPITNALARAAQQRQDRFVAPGPGGRDQTLDQKRIESSRKPSWDAASKLSPSFAHRLIATSQPVMHDSLTLLAERPVGHEVSHLASYHNECVEVSLRLVVGQVQCGPKLSGPVGIRNLGDLVASGEPPLQNRQMDEHVLGP
jgi:hypothetical protein